MSSTPAHVRYKRRNRRKRLVGVGSVGLLVLATAWSIAAGAAELSVVDVLQILSGEASATNETIVWRIRLPRVLSAIAAGLGLSVAGAAMQKVLNNPLGSPFTLGISQAAAFGAAVAVVVLSGTGVLVSQYVIAGSAFLFSLMSAGAILLLVVYTRATPETMILTGIALGSMFAAGTSALQYLADPSDVSAIVFWTFGDVGRPAYLELGVMSSVAAVATGYFVYNSWDYTALSAGDETAAGLGVDVRRLRVNGMVVASLVTATITAFVGIISFVGLVVPHIVRKLVGGDDRYVIPLSCVVGGLLLLVSDTVARTAFDPVVLPVGILTAFLGAPLFLYLVIRGREYW
ncbi:ABC-type Fe3+-siderophore transport system, permease component [Halalkaliarchaeum sp. AArc-CO]|uniref:FecCD family ABC transporter permease n=1 Tax=unclassified Halalkaliarchaeum TaxID=2678344 RepID=UPI00217E7DE0|nr:MULTISPECIES: iron ABC transporter permease [unclassified Halalkaliarchaeum]MDR5674131.1 iron ABC transporter permease [Halalkaliarchaeum sp. AArc-GB]UWG50852.1 ABC-type Fe3+-siderophore transport system, permease component [Halalkaliarchaeum sp. AArc-CO]